MTLAAGYRDNTHTIVIVEGRMAGRHNLHVFMYCTSDKISGKDRGGIILYRLPEYTPHTLGGKFGPTDRKDGRTNELSSGSIGLRSFAFVRVLSSKGGVGRPWTNYSPAAAAGVVPTSLGSKGRRQREREERRERGRKGDLVRDGRLKNGRSEGCRLLQPLNEYSKSILGLFCLKPTRCPRSGLKELVNLPEMPNPT